MHEVIFDVDGQLLAEPAERAAVLSEELRLTARGRRGAHGRAGALAVHELIEDRLTSESRAPIPLDGVAAVAVFYILKMNVEPTPLYRAVAPVRDRWDGDEPVYCENCGRTASEDEDATGWPSRRLDGVDFPFCPGCDAREFGTAG